MTLRHSLLKQGHDLSDFHAAEDKKANRDAKHFYPQFASALLKFVKKHTDAIGKAFKTTCSRERHSKPFHISRLPPSPRIELLASGSRLLLLEGVPETEKGLWFVSVSLADCAYPPMAPASMCQCARKTMKPRRGGGTDRRGGHDLSPPRRDGRVRQGRRARRRRGARRARPGAGAPMRRRGCSTRPPRPAGGPPGRAGS